MTAFAVVNETRNAFMRAYEGDPVARAYAVELYHFAGHECADAMNDGERITEVTLARVAPDWTPRKRRAVAASLVEHGFWRKTADGWAVVDWADTQRTAEQERKRRERDRLRKQAMRARQSAVQPVDNVIFDPRFHPFPPVDNSLPPLEIYEESGSCHGGRHGTPDPDLPSDHPSSTPREALRACGEAPPASPPTSDVIPIKKAREQAEKAPRRTRKPSPFDDARKRVEGVFNELYGAKYPGLRSTPKRYDLLANATKAYRTNDGLDEHRVRASVRAFLDDTWWQTKHPGRSTPPGHTLDHWAKHHATYDQKAYFDDLQDSMVVTRGF